VTGQYIVSIATTLEYQQLSTTKEDFKNLIDVEEMRRKIRMDLLQEKHWDEQQKYWEIQEKHWRWLGRVGVLAVVLNSVKSLWS